MKPYQTDALSVLEQGFCPACGSLFEMASDEIEDDHGERFVVIACSRRNCRIFGFFFPYLDHGHFALASEHWRILGGSRA